MGVFHHHPHVAPSTKFLQNLQWGPGHGMPAGKGMPEVVPPEIRLKLPCIAFPNPLTKPCSFASLVPGSLDLSDFLLVRGKGIAMNIYALPRKDIDILCPCTGQRFGKQSKTLLITPNTETS